MHGGKGVWMHIQVYDDGDGEVVLVMGTCNRPHSRRQPNKKGCQQGVLTKIFMRTTSQSETRSYVAVESRGEVESRKLSPV